MTTPRPAWSRESVLLRLPTAVDLQDFSPDWAFEGSTGAGVRVAVIDSGVEADHPMLDNAVDVDAGVEFTVDRSGRVTQTDGPHSDVYGHGTACAGIIHALAPEARITSIRVLDEGLRGRAAAFHAGLSWAVDQGFDVINLSLGAAKRDWALAFHDACDRGYFANTFIVTAANNIHRDSFPSLFASVASVASNGSDDPLRFHFNPEPPTEFLARGIDVVVPWLGGTTITTTGNSFAAPHIAGFAALIKSKHPELRPFQIKTALWAASANVRQASQTAPVFVVDDSRGYAKTSSRLASIRSATPSVAEPSHTPATPKEERRDRARPVMDQLRAEREEIQRFMSDYELGDLIARGPWGPVFAATKDGDSVALRRLDPTLGADDGTRARFATSVRIASGLRHPHILPILELREHEFFAIIAMPLCPSNLAAEPTWERPEAAVAAGLSLLSGLNAAHASGIYHGDLRPENALIDAHHRVVLSDVGIAASLTTDLRTDDDPTNPSSWHYLAPEQIDGGAVGAYTDIHAVGVLLFELFSGTLPYPQANSLTSFVDRRLAHPPRTLAEMAPALPRELVDVVDRAVSDEPSHRQGSARAMAAELTMAAELALGIDWQSRQPYRLELA